MFDFAGLGKSGVGSAVESGTGAIGEALGGGVLGGLSEGALAVGGAALIDLLGGSGRNDPDIVFSFYVEIDGIACVRFTEASGLEWKAETVSFVEGGNYRHKVNLVGQGSYSPLVLKKGFFAGSGTFHQWLKKTMDPSNGKAHKVSISLVVTNEASDEIGRFNLYNAFPTSYKGPAFNATENAVGFEEIEIVYDYFEFIPGGAMSGFTSAGAGWAAGQLGFGEKTDLGKLF